MFGELFLALALGQTPPPPVTPNPVAPAPGAVAAPAGPVNLPGDTGATTAPGTAAPFSAPVAQQQQDAAGDAEKQYFLMRLLEGSVAGDLLADSGTKIYGWTAMNYSGSSARRSNLPVTFNDRANFFQMNQNYLVVERGIDTTRDEVQLGYQTDLILPGTDARFTIARGLFEPQLRGNRDGTAVNYPIDLFQAFANVYLPGVGEGGTTVKVGKFATIIGYDVVQAPFDPFVTKSYVFQYNPFTHTGVLATTVLSDGFSVGNGVVLGNDNFIDPTARPTYLGFVRYAPDGGDTTAQLGVSATSPRFDRAEEFAHYNSYNFIMTHSFSDKFSYVFDGTFSHMDNIPDVGSANWFGMANYFIYNLSDRLVSTFRIELFNDTKGVRTGTEGLYTGATYGLSYAATDSVFVRPFARYDHNRNGAFEGKDNLYTGGIELVVRW